MKFFDNSRKYFLHNSVLTVAAGSHTPDNRLQGRINKLTKLTFIIIVLLDFFYWSFNSNSNFQINNFSLTYLSFIALFFLNCFVLNKKLLVAYLFFSSANLFFIGSLDAFKSITILFVILQLAIKFKDISIDEEFINSLLFIILFEVLAILYFGEVAVNVFGENEFFMGLSGSYKLLVYSLSLPLFVLGLCLAHTKSKFKILIIILLFNVIFYMIFKSYARAGLIYILFWALYLVATFSRIFRYVLITAFVSLFIFLFGILDSDIIYFLVEKGFSGRDEILISGLQNIFNNPLHFIFGIPGGASYSSKYDDLLLPDLGSLFISFYDYGIFGLCIFSLLIIKFIFGMIKFMNISNAPIFIFGFVSIIDMSASNYFALSTPSVLILWAILINNRNFICSSGVGVSSAIVRNC